MRNQDRIPSPSTLATAVGGVLKVAGKTIGTTSQSDGTYMVMRTNGGSLMAMPAPCARTADVPSNSVNASNTSAGSSSNASNTSSES